MSAQVGVELRRQSASHPSFIDEGLQLPYESPLIASSTVLASSMIS